MAVDASTVVVKVGHDDSGFQEGVTKIQIGLILVQRNLQQLAQN